MFDILVVDLHPGLLHNFVGVLDSIVFVSTSRIAEASFTVFTFQGFLERTEDAKQG